jgi:hypothetical protein
MKMKSLAGAICAGALVLPAAALAQGAEMRGSASSQDACERLVNYLQQYPDYDFPVTLEEARDLRQHQDDQTCIDRMREINTALGYDSSGQDMAGAADRDFEREPQQQQADRGRLQQDQRQLQAQGEFQQGQQSQLRAGDQQRSPGESAQVRQDAEGQARGPDAERTAEGQRPPQIMIEQAAPQVTVRQQQATVEVQQPRPEILVRQPAPTVTIDIPQPEITVRMPRPEVQVSEAQPEVSVDQPRPEVRVEPAQPDVQVERSGEPRVQVGQQQEAEIRYEREDPRVTINEPQGQPQVRFEQMGEQDQRSSQDQAGRDIGQSADRSRSQDLSGERQDQAGFAAPQEMGRGTQDQQDRMATASDPASQDDRDLTAVRRETRQQPAEGERQPDSDMASVDRSADAGMSGDINRQDSGFGAGLGGASGNTVPATELVGATVYSQDEQNVGKVSEIIVTDSGEVEAIVVDVGGFLGIGAKPVAVALSALDIRSSEEDELVVRSRFTEQQFEAAAEYDPQEYDRNRDAMLLTGSQ